MYGPLSFDNGSNSATTHLVVENSTIVNNEGFLPTGSWGLRHGIGIQAEYDTVKVTNCIIYNNIAHYYGFQEYKSQYVWKWPTTLLK